MVFLNVFWKLIYYNLPHEESINLALEFIIKENSNKVTITEL